MFKKRAKRFEGIDFMTLIPRRIVDHEQSGDSRQTVLLLPRYKKGLMKRFLQPLLPQDKMFIRIPLEERGQWLWHEMDGRRNIGSMVADFAERFPEDQGQVPTRVGAYLNRMEDQGLIEFAGMTEKTHK